MLCDMFFCVCVALLLLLSVKLFIANEMGRWNVPNEWAFLLQSRVPGILCQTANLNHGLPFQVSWTVTDFTFYFHLTISAI